MEKEVFPKNVLQYMKKIQKDFPNIVKKSKKEVKNLTKQFIFSIDNKST
jgi:hypothetical protein